MREWRINRQNLFLRIHKEYPNLTQSEVAAKATEEALEKEFNKLKESSPNSDDDDLWTKAGLKVEELYNDIKFTLDDVKYDLSKSGLWKLEE